MLIIYEDLGTGWSPITYMVQLCAELLSAELVILDRKHGVQRLENFLAYLPRWRGLQTCLVVTAGPQHLPLLFRVPGWRRRFQHIAAWVIDSFWPEYIPHVVRFKGMFDQFFITTEEDIEAWESLTQRPIAVLPWGADVLRFGSKEQVRPVDLLRVGRQPPEWENDRLTANAAMDRNICFQGRPPHHENAKDNQRTLFQRYAHSKFLLAFSNVAHSSPYTHPSRAYLTARWTEGLAAGAIIAGIAPNSMTSNKLLWPGATLELGSVRRNEGMEILSGAVDSWRPERAGLNYLMALKLLDWRWRFIELAKHMGLKPALLLNELEMLNNKIEENQHFSAR